MTDLHYLSATEALERFRSRDLSPVELLDAVIARAEEVEPTVNALCHTFCDEAREQARAAEARYAGKGEPPRRARGHPARRQGGGGDRGPAVDAGLADLQGPCRRLHARRSPSGMLEAGRDRPRAHDRAGVLLRGLHALAPVGRDPQPVEPGVRRRRLLRRLGRGARVGTTTLASGSDIGGSIRIPASFNGVVGFKPPYGRVPVDPPFNLDVYCHCGPLARTVADCALYENVVAGPDPSDIATLRPKLRAPRDASRASRGCASRSRVDLGDWPVDPEVRANTRAVGEALRAAGAIVDEVDLQCPDADVQLATRDPLRARCSATGSGARCAEHGEQRHGLRDRDGALVRGARRRRTRSSRGSSSRRDCTRRSARCSRSTTRSSARPPAPAG